MKYTLFLKFSILFLLLGKMCSGQGFDYKENAVYIYNFIKYTDWAGKKNEVQIGIIGNTPEEAELRNLVSRKKTSNLILSIRNITASEAKNVDVVLVANSAAADTKLIDKSTEHQPILIVSEKENQNRFGACISFFIDEENNFKTEYQLSMRNCKLRGLKINEQILNNAVLTR